MIDLIGKILSKDHFSSEEKFDRLAGKMAGLQARRYQRGNVPSQLGRRTWRVIESIRSKIFASFG